MNLPASIPAFSGWIGEIPLANSSVFTNSLEFQVKIFIK